MRRGALTGLVVLVLGAAVAAWALRDDGAVAPHSRADDATRGGPAPPVAATPAGAALPGASVSANADAARTAVADATPAPADPATTTVRGRCVDAAGLPLAGCTVSLGGALADGHRREEWLRANPQPEWTHPPVLTTGADGTFAISFRPPPTFWFWLGITRDGCVRMSTRWSWLRAGTVVDVGDVVLGPGVLVEGVVVDERDRPMPNVQLSLSVGRVVPSPAEGGFEPQLHANATSDRNGTFRASHLLAAGPMRLAPNGDEELAAPADITLSLERPRATVRVVLRDLDALPSIRGRVVDDAGQPVAVAQVERRDAHARGSNARTKRDGTFVVRNRDGSSGDVALVALADGCEPSAPVHVAWGANDVVLTVQRGGALAVYVHDEAGVAIPDFQVRLFPREQGRISSEDSKVRARPPYANGFATVRGVARAKWTVVTEFPPASGRVPVLTPIETTTTGTLRVDVRAPASGNRTLRVVDAADRPVAGTKVTLTLQTDGRWDDATKPVALEQLIWADQRNRALVLQTGATAADGTFVLAGPPAVDLGVAVDGPGHVPLRVGGVRVEDPGELVVRVATGARLRGTVTPPDAVAELRRLAGGELDDNEPRIALRRAERGAERFPRDRDDTRGVVGADGAFVLDGVPPGTWRAELHYYVSFHGYGSRRTEPLGDVTVRDGETIELTHDLARFLPGTLTARVLKNGAPLANEQVTLEDAERSFPVRTDGDGRFTLPLRAGAWRVVARHEHRNVWTSWTSVEAATVTAGATTEQIFRLAVGVLAVTLRAANGEPVGGLQLHARAADGAVRPLPVTDRDGRTEVQWDARTYAFEVLPRRLLDPAAQQELWRAATARGENDPITRHLLQVGSATVTAGQTTAIELKLPPEWEK
jgi:hypothetical protein